MIYKSILILFSVFFGYVANSQSKYTSFEKSKNGYDTISKNGKLLMKGDIFKNENFEYLNSNEAYIKNYHKRYTYLNGQYENVTNHLSTVLADDTSSRSYKGYYLDIHPSYLSDRVVPISYLSKGVITNRDWNKFKAYVRDSIALRILASDQSPEDYQIPSYIRDKNGLYEADIYEWPLNWNAKIDFNKTPTNFLYPSLAQLNYSPHQRFRSKIETDARKLQYIYTEVQNKTIRENMLKDVLEMHEFSDTIRARNVLWDDYYRDYSSTHYIPLYVDSLLWKSQSKNPHHGDIADQLISQYGSYERFLDSPVVGITSMQVKAYLHWLQTEHQKQLNKNKKWYYVEYALPTPLELEGIDPINNKITIPAFDLSPWTITNADYKEFLDYTIDSLIITIAGQQLGPDGLLIPTLDDYLNETDIYQWVINWKNLKNVHNDIRYYDLIKNEGLFYPEYLADSTKLFDFDYRYIKYIHYQYNFQSAAPLGQLEEQDHFGYTECDKHILETKNITQNYWEDYKNGKNMILSSPNNTCQNADVRSHEDRSQFIEEFRTNIYPGVICYSDRICESYYETHPELGDTCCKMDDYENQRLPEYDFTSFPNNAITNITYRQALAFYNWKQKHKGYVTKHDNAIIANYIPAEKEWIEIQNGKKITHSEESFQYTTPLAKYVVRFYPRNSKSTVPGLPKISQYARHPGAQFSASKTERKKFLKLINADLSEYNEANDIQIIRNKTSKLWGLYTNDNEVRELVPQSFHSIEFLKDTLQHFAECYNSKGQKTCFIPNKVYENMETNLFFDEINYRKTNNGNFQVLAQKSSNWGVLNPHNGQLIYACDAADIKDIPVFSIDGLNYLQSYINKRKSQGDISFMPDGNGDGVFYAKNKHNKWGLYQMDQAIIPAQYDKIEIIGFNPNFTLVWNNNKVGVWSGIFSAGKESVPCLYDGAKRIRLSGYYYLAAQKNGKWGYVDWYNGDILLDFKYDTFESLPYCKDYKSSFYK